MDAISTFWSDSTGPRRGVALPPSSLTGPGTRHRLSPQVLRVEGSQPSGSQKPLACLLGKFHFKLQEREGTSVSHRSCGVPLSHSAPGGADVELASLGPAGARLPGSDPSLVRPSPRAGRAPATACQPPAEAAAEAELPLGGRRWMASSSFSLPHPSVGLASSSSSSSGSPLRGWAEPRCAACWPQGCRRGGWRLPSLPAGPPPLPSDIGRGLPRVAPGAGAPVPRGSRTSPCRRGAGRRAGSAPAAQARSPSFPLAVRRAAGGSGL